MEPKQCTKCGEIKPLDMFKKDRRHTDGYGSHCRKCNYALYGKGRDRSKYTGRYKGRYVGKYKETFKKSVAEWHDANPLAHSAHNAVAKAISAGHVPRVDSLACQQCGQQAAHYHHYIGYEPAHRLHVIPLCFVCHRLIRVRA